MKLLKNLLLLSILLLLLFQGRATANNTYKPVILAETPKNLHIKVMPRLELLAGVFSQTSWMEIGGPKNEGNKYFQELQIFFRL